MIAVFAGAARRTRAMINGYTVVEVKAGSPYRCRDAFAPRVARFSSNTTLTGYTFVPGECQSEGLTVNGSSKQKHNHSCLS